VLLDAELQAVLGKEFTKWHARVLGQVESARQYLFGEAFRPRLQPKPLEKKGRSRARAA